MDDKWTILATHPGFQMRMLLMLFGFLEKMEFVRLKQNEQICSIEWNK